MQESRLAYETREFTLVIGATGTTGSRIAARLLAAGHPVKAASRRARPVHGAHSVRFDWDDPTSFDGAVEGVDRIYLIPPLGSPDPAAVMVPFLRRARASGIRRAVLLGSSAIPAGGPAVGRVQEALPDLVPEWAVLRPSWFMQNFTGDHVHAQTIRTHGAIRTATGAGRVGFVDADDIAAVAVHALTDAQAPNAELILTGPRALGYDEIAAVLTRVTGRTITHQRLTREQMYDRLATDIPAEFAAMLADMDQAIAAGAEDRTTDTVQRLTGRPPHPFHTVARRELGRHGT
ncbi:NAD(P)H-binding protein [Embleya sp. NPDC050154]|uniref:NmrA family NAD(P)-binding protein n=1 Tax=Embleya sp. NPDC050154 TaxID=3363988 RepID=UPI0037B024FF